MVNLQWCPNGQPDYGIDRDRDRLIPITLNPIRTHLLHITQLSDLCCLEETTTKLVYGDRFRPITAVAMQFLLPPGQTVKCNYKHICDCKQDIPDW